MSLDHPHAGKAADAGADTRNQVLSSRLRLQQDALPATTFVHLLLTTGAGMGSDEARSPVART